jgi:hypothetical protein
MSSAEDVTLHVLPADDKADTGEPTQAFQDFSWF